MSRSKFTQQPPLVLDPELDQARIDTATAQMRMEAREQSLVVAQQSERAVAVAREIGYDGSLTVGALEDEIRFYQRRTVEAILETGKRLLVLKELTPHGEFTTRVEMLGFSDRTARRFMQAAVKTSKSANLAVLSTQLKSASAFLELVTHDDDVLSEVAGMDDIDRMSITQVRATVRELQAEKLASDMRRGDLMKENDELRIKAARIKTTPPDEALAQTQAEATVHMNDALGAIRGKLRAAIATLNDMPDAPAKVAFMAGLVGTLQAELTGLRNDYQLPDISVDATPAWLKDNS